MDLEKIMMRWIGLRIIMMRWITLGKIINKYEIVLKQQLDTVSYLEEQKISAGLHLKIKNKSLLALRRN